MSFEYRDAKRQDTRLLIGLAGGTGSGKTESAMRLATGLAGGRPFAVLDTESGRALHKADDYKFKHGDLVAPFTPERYWEAIAAADVAGYPVIVIDSFSHVWEGVGGVLDMQQEEYERLGGTQKVAPQSWIKPKGRHRRLVNQMLQVRAHLIVCMRAQDKIEIVKEGGKTVVRPAQSLIGAEGWVPISERRFPHELTLSLLLLQSKPGVPVSIKLERRHAEFVSLTNQLDEETGRKLAEWARGTQDRPEPGRTDGKPAAGDEAPQAEVVATEPGEPTTSAASSFSAPTGAADSPDVIAANEAAGFVIEVDSSKHRGKTLREVAESPAGETWFKWSLRHWHTDPLRSAIYDFAKVYLPDLYAEVAQQELVS